MVELLWYIQIQSIFHIGVELSTHDCRKERVEVRSLAFVNSDVLLLTVVVPDIRWHHKVTEEAIREQDLDLFRMRG